LFCGGGGAFPKRSLVAFGLSEPQAAEKKIGVEFLMNLTFISKVVDIFGQIDEAFLFFYIV
jgi:hypothetical protein